MGNDYITGGMLLVGRTWEASGTDKYKFGFNGQLKDDEIYGAGNSYSAEFWQYDPRLMRRWNQDPVVIHSQSPYSAFGNNPIFYIDEFGDTKDWYHHKNEDGSSAVLWQEGNAESITMDGQEYQNIGEDFVSTHVSGGVIMTEKFHQDESVSFTTSEIQQLNCNYNPCHPEGYYQAISTYEAYSKLDIEGGQLYFPRPQWLDPILGGRTHGNYQVSAEGYVTDKFAIQGGTPPAWIGGPKGIPKMPRFYKGMSLEEQGIAISKRINTNNAYIKTTMGAKRYSLAGAADAGVPTPHYHLYQKNFVNGEVLSISKVKGQPIPMSQEDIRLIRKYLEKTGKL